MISFLIWIANVCNQARISYCLFSLLFRFIITSFSQLFNVCMLFFSFFSSSLPIFPSPSSPYPLLLLFNIANHSFPTSSYHILCLPDSLFLRFPLEKNQASQGYKLNTSPQDTIRQGTKPSSQGWMRQSSHDLKTRQKNQIHAYSHCQ